MNLQRIIYLSFILVFACIEPTLLDKDCNGVIGGNALVDDCGSCTGGTTNLNFNYFWGCDGECKGRQFDCTYPGDSTCTASDPPGTCITACDGDFINDCNDDCIHKDDAREFDLCGVCDPCDNGTKGDDCELWNSICKGCTDPNAACGSYDEDTEVYELGSCVQFDYFCSDNAIPLDVDENGDGLDDTTDEWVGFKLDDKKEWCPDSSFSNNCGPGTNLCKFNNIIECSVPEDSIYFLPCNIKLVESAFIVSKSDLGDGVCDYYGKSGDTLLNLTSCPEFNYDEGDCNLVDCRGMHFSDDLCATNIEYEPSIDILIDISPDTVVTRTSTLITKIEGCTNGLYTNFTTVDTIYSYNSIDSVVTTIDSTVIGSRGWLGDGECDSVDNEGEEGDLIKNYNLDFNCIEYNYEEGDCYNPSEVNSYQRKKSKFIRMYQPINQENRIDLSNLIEK